MIFPQKWKSNVNVLFIIPELSVIFPNNTSDAESVDVVHPPLGVLYISSYCRSKGFQPFVIDQLVRKSYSDDELREFIRSKQINIVGISCTMSANYTTALKYAELCKTCGCITVLGGAHVSATVSETASVPYIDIVTYGEGEETWYELLSRFFYGQSIAGIPGIAYKNDSGTLVIERKRELINDLDLLPFPDYACINMDDYVSIGALGIITSRGCTNRCTFCTSHCTWGQKVRFRSPENIVAELDWLVAKYDYSGKTILFYDDNFTLDKNRVMRLCDLLQQRNYRIKWKCMSRVTGIDAEMLGAMRKAGCFSISFGFESGVEKSLMLMRKGITLADIERAIDICNSSGIETHGYFIIGFPWENREDLNKTIDFIISHPQISPALNFLTPFPGTTYFDNPEKWGITISKDWDRYTNLSVVTHCDNHSSQDLFDAYARYLFYMEERNNEN